MYKIIISESALKQLHRFPKPIVKKIQISVDKLTENPRPLGVKKLKGNEEDLYRIRVGDYRVVYSIDDGIKIIDIRKESEYEAEHIENAYSRPLNKINNWISEINPIEHFYLHCAGGYRSVIAASILKKEGIHNIRNVLGGWGKIKLQEKAEIIKEASVLN